MKKYQVLAAACITFLFCSCTKESFDSPITNNVTTSDASFEADASAPALKPNKAVNYGAMINPPPQQDYVKFQFDVAGQLGVSCLRVRALVPSDRPNPVVDNKDNKYNIVLNFNRGDFQGTAMRFTKDLVQYKTDLTKTLALYKTKPAVAVIENEESNAKYYNGSAKEYIDMITTAVDVMHGSGIKVANGGITSTGLCYLVYQDFLSQGKYDSAQQFKLMAKVSPNYVPTQQRGAFIDTLLQAYAQIGVDYINFHWKAESPDTQTLTSVIAYLKKRTNKPIMSNEFGQFDTDTNTIEAVLQKATDENFAYVLWYSPHQKAGKRDTPLNFDNASLTPSGKSYQSYLTK